MRCRTVAKSELGSCIMALISRSESSLMSALSGCVTYVRSRAKLAGRLYEP